MWSPKARSETFIAAHVDGLAPGRTVVLCQNLTELQPLDLPCLAWGPGRGEYRWIKRKFLGAYELFRTGSFLRFDQKQEMAVQKFLSEHGVQTVLAHYGPVACLFGRVCKKLGVRLFVNFHGYDVSMLLNEQRYRNEYRKLAQLVDGAIVPAHFLARRLSASGFPMPGINVIPAGVSPNRFLGDGHNKKRGLLLAIGRFVEKKRPDSTIKAFALVAHEFPFSTLEMIGDGPLLSYCTELVVRLQLVDRVVFHGPAPHDFVLRKLSEAHAFVQHSATSASGDTEGLPNAVLEAMIASVPVIATRHAGIPEAVIDGETGLLVEEGDVEGMAEALRRVLASENLAMRLGQAGASRARAHFLRDDCLARLRDVLGLDDG